MSRNSAAESPAVNRLVLSSNLSGTAKAEIISPIAHSLKYNLKTRQIEPTSREGEVRKRHL